MIYSYAVFFYVFIQIYADMFGDSSWATDGSRLYGSKFRTATVILKFPVFQALRRSYLSAPSQLSAYNTLVGWNGNINQEEVFLLSLFSFISGLFVRICLSALNVSKLMLCHSVRILTRRFTV
jgi:hypothetical protein